MTELVTVLIAMVITAVVASSITSMSLAPIKTQRQKSNYATAEGLAIAIRKCIVDNPSTFVKDADITDAKVKASSCYTALNISGDASCSVKNSYSPYGTGVVIPYAVECKVGKSTDRQQAQAWQPLYTTTNFNEQIGAGTGPIDIKQCLLDISTARTPFSNPGSLLTLSDLSAYSGCKNVKSSLTLSPLSGLQQTNIFVTSQWFLMVTSWLTRLRPILPLRLRVLAVDFR